MKFVDITFDDTAENVVSFLSDNDAVNSGVNFDDSRGIPHMRIKKKDNGRIRMTCELVGGPTKDNGFFVGTYFSGKLTEIDGRTRVKGVITTAPIYHSVLFAFVIVFLIQCIRLGGFSVIPPIIIVFDIFMFKNEFKKQGYILRYLYRAAKRLRSK